jgi:hypothetical protein
MDARELTDLNLGTYLMIHGVAAARIILELEDAREAYAAAMREPWDIRSKASTAAFHARVDEAQQRVWRAEAAYRELVRALRIFAAPPEMKR